MIRPDIKDYIDTNWETAKDTYLRDLEYYCNSLEDRYKVLRDLSDGIVDKADQLDKALESACRLLVMHEEFSSLDGSYHTGEQWKEYLLNNND